jgi:hypothetical protein
VGSVDIYPCLKFRKPSLSGNDLSSVCVCIPDTMKKITICIGISALLLCFSLVSVTLADCGSGESTPQFFKVGGVTYNAAGQVVTTTDADGNTNYFDTSDIYQSAISDNAGTYMTSTSGITAGLKNASANQTKQNLTTNQTTNKSSST